MLTSRRKYIIRDILCQCRAGVGDKTHSRSPCCPRRGKEVEFDFLELFEIAGVEAAEVNHLEIKRLRDW
jgi:hypothetical protein